MLRQETVALGEMLDRHTREGELYQRLENNAVLCYACGHRCVARDGLRGICKVRFNKDGKLQVPWGYVAALQCDPTEKKPFFHVLPGSLTMTFGMLGCDFHCPYCQNWLTSQALRDSEAGYFPQPMEAEQIAALATRSGASLVGSSYNEPLITSEWAVEVFRQARERGLRTCYVSNGNATPEVLEYLRPWVDAYKIDLKSMSDRQYRKLGGVLAHVLDTIRMVHALDFWTEVVTLVVPGFNDSDQELRETARFLVSVSRDIPWHVTAFHSDYKMQDRENTAPDILARAAAIGREEGLRFAYAGNVPGALRDMENTYCPHCNTLLVERYGFQVLRYAITGAGTCPGCGTRIPGVWWGEGEAPPSSGGTIGYLA
ncbi:MAG: AmmeMemoRadiSam system radical SAM enzyme [Chloroflexi bacterium]|nr:AmmeMemoRadiSam system radical SAM enzyme [Chloroflexota bacterium]